MAAVFRDALSTAVESIEPVAAASRPRQGRRGKDVLKGVKPEFELEEQPLGDCCYCLSALAHAMDQHRRAQACVEASRGWLCPALLCELQRALLRGREKQTAVACAYAFALLCHMRGRHTGALAQARVCLYTMLVQPRHGLVHAVHLVDALVAGWATVLPAGTNTTDATAAGEQPDTDGLSLAIREVLTERCGVLCQSTRRGGEAGGEPTQQEALHYWRRIQQRCGCVRRRAGTARWITGARAWLNERAYGTHRWAPSSAPAVAGGAASAAGYLRLVPVLMQQALAPRLSAEFLQRLEGSPRAVEDEAATAELLATAKSVAERALVLIGCEQGWDWAYRTLVVDVAVRPPCPERRAT
jgi:hypothetical protein